MVVLPLYRLQLIPTEIPRDAATRFFTAEELFPLESRACANKDA